jgi:hypothetical protein
MVAPFGSARERRSRTTYRPTVTPEGSTHVESFTGTTSSVSCTVSGTLAVINPASRENFPRGMPGEEGPGRRGISLLACSPKLLMLDARELMVSRSRSYPDDY